MLDGATVRALTIATGDADPTKKHMLTPPAATAKAERGYLLGADRLLIVWGTTVGKATTLTASLYALTGTGTTAASTSVVIKSVPLRAL